MDIEQIFTRISIIAYTADLFYYRHISHPQF